MYRSISKPSSSHPSSVAERQVDDVELKMGLKDMARADALRAPPAWLELLLAAVFFEACPAHPDASLATRSGGCNFFCTTCTDRPLCPDCAEAGEHDGHQLIQIRKVSRHPAIKLKDLESLLDAGEVQPYRHNNFPVVYLNPRPVEGKGNKTGEHDAGCKHCGRAMIKKRYRFCSLRCKLECMKDDLDISFAVPKGDDDDPEADEEDSSRPAKRLRSIGSGSGIAGAAGTSTSPSEPPPAEVTAN